MQSRMIWAKNFRDSFFERFACPSEKFEKRVFWRALYRCSLPLAVLVYVLYRRYFDMDFQVIRQLGVAISADEFYSELDSYRSEYRMQRGFLRNTLRVRVSGKRLMRILEETTLEVRYSNE